jgi:transcriptional antiterminator NusG
VIFVENEELMEAKIDSIETSENIQESAVSEQAIESVVSITSASENRIEDSTEIKVDSAIEDAKWYVLHTFSGYENVAKENLEIVKDKYNLQERIFDIVYPMEDVVEDNNGKKKIVSRKVMPGYIMVKMIYGDDIWHAVTRTQYISSFVGPKGRPVCITEDEVARLGLGKITVNIDINVDDIIEILDGPLASFVGKVSEVDKDNLKLKAVVEMFGRDSIVELNFNQVRVKA